MTKTSPLTTEQIQGLAKQSFNLEQPGRILKDFGNLLKFIEDNNGIEVTPNKHLFAIKLLPELNRLMSKPLDVQLKRPVQKTFPYLNGLYLLLRASGLVSVHTKGKAAKLIINESVLDSWNALNDTERYFALLTAWYYRSDDEIIAEKGMYRGFHGCLMFIHQLHNEKAGIYTLKDKNEAYILSFEPGLHGLALLELFGFVDIKTGKPFAAEHWPVVEVRTTDWGNLLSTCFPKTGYGFGLWAIFKEDDSLSHWEMELKKHLPDWKNDLQSLDTGVVTEGSYVLKVSLGKVYRKFTVPADSLLDDLAYAILDAFDFDDDHLYEFIYKDSYGITESIAHPVVDSDHEFCTADATVGHLPLHPGMSFIFHFDFGDDWQFLIEVEEPASSPVAATDIVLIEKHGEAPEQYDYDEYEDYDEEDD